MRHRHPPAPSPASATKKIRRGKNANSPTDFQPEAPKRQTSEWQPRKIRPYCSRIRKGSPWSALMRRKTKTLRMAMGVVAATIHTKNILKHLVVTNENTYGMGDVFSDDFKSAFYCACLQESNRTMHTGYAISLPSDKVNNSMLHVFVTGQDFQAFLNCTVFVFYFDSSLKLLCIRQGLFVQFAFNFKGYISFVGFATRRSTGGNQIWHFLWSNKKCLEGSIYCTHSSRGTNFSKKWRWCCLSQLGTAVW